MMQTKPYSLTQYLAAGCETLTRNGRLDAIGAGIHGATGGKPCNGCYANKGCAALAKLLAMDGTLLRSVAPAPETVRQEAARRGLSIGEVRRQRQAAVGAA